MQKMAIGENIPVLEFIIADSAIPLMLAKCMAGIARLSGISETMQNLN